MANSTINANTNGLNSTAGNANVLDIQTGGVTAMTINASQVVSFTNPPAGVGFASGTVMLFGQTAAPTGWTKDAVNYNNHALRIVTGTASTGGTVDFTTAFASQAVSGTVGTSGATTLATTDIPSHTHTPRTNTATQGGNPCIPSSLTWSTWTTVPYNLSTTTATGGGGSHTHTGGTFTGTAINLAVKYVDVIRATKD